MCVVVYSMASGGGVSFLKGVQQTMSGACIWVIDDQPEIGELLVLYLEHHAYLGHHCASGGDALQLLLQPAPQPCRPALLILDLEMPELDGEAFLQQLRAGWDPAGGTLPPVLVLSAQVDLPRPEQLGVQLVLPKPFHLRTVLGAVRSILGPGAPHDDPGGGDGSE